MKVGGPGDAGLAAEGFRPVLSWGAAMENKRSYERIPVSLPVRLYIEGEKGLDFQAFCQAHNMGLRGLFIRSDFLLAEGLELMAELKLPDGPLAIRSQVAHRLLEEEGETTGIGIEFLEVDAAGRETLLRYFTPDRYKRFHADFVAEFPHLKNRHPIRDVALLLNLWEEWKVKRKIEEPIELSSPVRPPSRRTR